MTRAPKQSGVFVTRSPAGTAALGARLGSHWGVGDCVALIGELGAGKTALVRGIAAGLGLAQKNLVSSPTFVLVQEYPCRVPVYHIDLYRLHDAGSELAALGIEEMIAEGVVLIEWADRAGDRLPHPRWEIRIEHTGQTSRRFEVSRVE